ncbi:MAG: flagellar hook capping FlgD N-terminal domain-containing protein [Sulfitobacter sp.]
MDISPTNTTGLNAPNTPQQQTSVLSSDFETFLTMLTAQAKYQDPLEPIDSSEYAAQLAQFSMVEQQVMSNDLLTVLSGQMGSGNLAQLAGWIGMEARTTAPVQFNGQPITVFTSSQTGAEEAYLVVRDEFDRDVQRLSIPIADGDVEWTGVADDGSSFLTGLYSFAVESSAGGQVLGTSAAETYAKVTEVSNQDGQARIILQGGAEISAQSVTALRSPVT